MPNERLALLLILLLSALLAVPAKGAVRPPVASPDVHGALRALGAPEVIEAEAEEVEGGEEEASEAEECEVGEEECEAEEGGEEEAPEECLLASAQATVEANAHADRLHVSIRYRTFQPAAVTVTYQLRGSAGSAHLGAVQAHFGRKGVFHDTVAISGRELSKVIAAREVAIGLHALNTPAYCRQVFQQRLTPKRAGKRLLFS